MVFKKKDNELSVAEVASELGISRQAVNVYIDKGELKAEKRGRKWFVKREHLDEFISQNTNRNY